MAEPANPLLRLAALGQSVWLDYVRRDLMVNGGLMRLIKDDGVRGVASNPPIFEGPVGESPAYERDIRAMALTGQSAMAIYESLTQQDVHYAAEELRPLYDRLDGRDGFVCLEVNPHFAHDTRATLAEARRLWAVLDRPNVMIKVPATDQGLQALRALITEGINVNVTHIFGVKRWRQAAEAYLDGLEARAASGNPLGRVASVASLSVERIDAALDPHLAAAGGALGQTGVATGKLAYAEQSSLFSGRRFLMLAAKGARAQRLLWAGSGIHYVDGLIGLETVTTMPMATLEAYRSHGDPQLRLNQGLPEARRQVDDLAGHGIDLAHADRLLEEEGVKTLQQAFDGLLAALDKAQARLPVRR